MEADEELNPYQFEPPPPLEKPARRKGPLKVGKMTPELRAKQQRVKISNQVRRGRSITRSGLLLLACLYGLIAFTTGFVSLRFGGGLDVAFFLVGVPVCLCLLHVGLFFWARKSKVLPPVMIALGCGFLAMAALLLTGQLVWFGLVLIACGYCVVGLRSFRRHRDLYRALVQQHRERGLIAPSPQVETPVDEPAL